MYAIFQKMMTKMMSEQAGTSSDKDPFSQRIRDRGAKKATKSSKKNVQDILDEDDTEEECEIIPEITHKTKVQAVTDHFQAQFKEMARVVKDLQARDKSKKVFTSEDFYDSLEGDENLENLPRKFIKFDGSGDPKAHLAMFFAECSKFSRQKFKQWQIIFKHNSKKWLEW